MARRCIRQPQRGAALLIFMVFMVLGTLAYLVNSVSPAEIELKRQRQTEAALAMAKDALIGYALQYRDQQAAHDPPDLDAMYGFLPMPDVGSSRFHASQTPDCNTEGCAMSFVNGAFPATTDTVIGRLPWRTLGIPPLRDGYGECLWYAVSAAHKNLGIDPAISMNWDTLGQLDFVEVNGGALVAKNTSAYDRPAAIIFSPGALRTGQDRCQDKNNPSECLFAQGNEVTQCGGNYAVSNYLDTTHLAPVFTSTNGASGLTNNPPSNPPKPFGTNGKIPTPENHFANDTGLPITSGYLFESIRKNKNFRNDINTMLDRMVGCLRDQFLVTGKTFVADSISGYTPSGKIAGRIPDEDIDNDLIANAVDTDFPATGIATASTCYDDAVHPMGYFSHYKDQLFVAKSTGANFMVTTNGTSGACAGVLIFSGQRDTTTIRCPASPTPTSVQSRITEGERNNLCNYLEGDNLASFTGSGITFTGAKELSAISPNQSGHQDIVRCIPNSASLKPVDSANLEDLGGQLTAYNPETRTLTLGRLFSIAETTRAAKSGAFYGCIWTPEVHPLGSGFRSYFNFKIIDTGYGFTFAVIDADRNGSNVCGRDQEYLGYAGNNGVSEIAYPKIGIELDTSRNSSRNDPNENPSGQTSHVAIVYWGADGTIGDDNKHGAPSPPDASLRPAPRNPPPEDVSTTNSGIAYLPGSSIPTDVNIHVRIEVKRTATNTAQHSNTYQIDVWLEKGDSHGDIIAAMKNTTRPFATLYADADSAVSTHIRDAPTIYDKQGGACATDSPCPAGQVCGTDNLCYTRGFDSTRLGFTTAQSSSTAAKDQIINISDFVTTWLP